MESPRLRKRISKSRESENITIIPIDEKIEVEIRDIIRVRPQDFQAIKNSLEEWAKQWE